MKNLSRLLIPLCLPPLFCAALFAQKTSGSISGQVTDPSGAAIPNATVRLLNPSVGLNRSVTTNSQGEYTFDDVAIGTYEVDVESTSFEKSATKGVIVNVGTSTRSDAHLVAGNVSETVEVSAAAVQVQTDSGSLGNIIDGTQVKELPLNGRSFVELTQLGPGVSGANNFDSKNKGLQGGVDFSVNGNPTTNNLFLVDGANNNDVGSNRTILIYPSIESIAEFKMLTNSYGPEYGQASGAVISIATRSGTNAFHGSVIYSGRNDALAAYTYFSRANAGQGKPLDGKDKLRRNDWGYSIGGPVKKDKLFFFFNQEWNHEIRAYTQNACVATLAERTGDFTNVVGHNANGQALNTCGQTQPTFADGTHKLATVDPAGALLAQYYTLPNKATDSNGNNWSDSLATALNWRQENVRVDYNISPRNTVMGRYVQDTWTNPSYNGNQYWGDTIFPVVNGNWAQPSKQIIGRYTSTISNTLVNDAEFAYSNNRINITAGGTDPQLVSQLAAAIPTLYPTTFKNNKAGSTPTVWGGLGGYGSGNTIWSIAPWNNKLDIYTVRDDVSKVLGSHALKVGFFLGFNAKDEDSGPASSEHPTLGGVFQLKDSAGNILPGSGLVTGNPLADVLIPNQPFNLSETSTNVRAQLRWRDREFYFGDTWKARPRLTVNYGVRYSLLPTTYNPNGLETNFVPSLYNKALPASDICNGLTAVPGKTPCADANKTFGLNLTEATPGPNKYLVNQNYHLFAPRIGLAYDVHGDGKTALRAGFGEFYQRERVSRYQLVDNAPFAFNTNNYERALGGATPASLSGGQASLSGGYATDNTLPVSIQYNLTVEQNLAKNTVLQVSYVGNRGEHLTSSYDVNGVLPQNYLAATFDTSNHTNSYRPFPNLASLTYWSHNGDSYYNGLQTLFRTQLGQFRFQAAYTWSHAIADIVTDDSGGGSGASSFTVPSNPRRDRGSTATNRPNIFVANGTYVFSQLAGRSTLVQQTLGGWELTGIQTANSGNSYTLFQGGVGENTGAFLPGYTHSSNLGALFQSGLTSNQRPTLAQGQTCNSAGISGNQIVNPNAFTLIGYHLGTVDPNTAERGSCHGPRLINTDLSLDKNWKIHDRATVQFRFDAFDLLNHANFRADQLNNGTAVGNVNCGPGTLNAGVVQYAPCSTTNNVVSNQIQNVGFGKSTGLVGNAERQFQYGLHINF